MDMSLQFPLADIGEVVEFDLAQDRRTRVLYISTAWQVYLEGCDLARVACVFLSFHHGTRKLLQNAFRRQEKSYSKNL